MKPEIIPAVLPGTKKELLAALKIIERYSKTIQIDIADGKFVKNRTIMPALLKGLKSKAEFHLMVKNPGKYIQDCKKAGAKSVVVHAESMKNAAVIEAIKTARMKAGIALNPDTRAEKIRQYLDKIDIVLVMTVAPGKQGQKFLKSQLKKIRQIRKWSRKVNIEVDGGINPYTIVMAKKAGANMFVVGSYLFREKSVRTALQKLKRLINK
jgi:ribulose-phosphate 3-epimerase